MNIRIIIESKYTNGIIKLTGTKYNLYIPFSIKNANSKSTYIGNTIIETTETVEPEEVE